MKKAKFSPRKAAKELGMKFYVGGKPCKNGHNGLRTVSDATCYECRQIKWSLENKPKDLEKRKRNMLSAIKSHAKRKKIPFNIELDDVIWNTICPILGTELDYFTSKKGVHSPSFDKILPKLGYVKGNVAIISNKANAMKSNGTLEHFKRLVKYMENKIND